MIEKSVVLACACERAFALFTERASEWWPELLRHTGDAGSQITLLASGRFWERAADGREVELGRVTAWEPPSRLALDFYPGTDPLHPTEVVVRFSAEGDRTRVVIQHRPTVASADLWAAGAPRFERSWGRVLAALEDAAVRYYGNSPVTTMQTDPGAHMTTGSGTREDPWVLKTPPHSSEFTAFRDEALEPPALVVRVGKTELRYQLRCIDDLHSMLAARGDWVPLGAADEQKPAADGTVEAWGRDESNPVGGWYGLKKGLRGRFGVYVPPVLEVLGLAEVEHNARNNRMRAAG